MQFNKKDKILIIAAHPDDEVLGCGGTISSLRNKGVETRIVFLSEGVSSRFNINQKNLGNITKEIKLRNNNSIKALKILGINKKNIFFENHPCCQLDTIPRLNLIKIIEKHISIFKPSVIFTHYMNDVNIDHKITFKYVLAATRPHGNKFIKSIYLFEVLSSTEWNFVKPFPANCFFDISKTIKKKISAMKAYGKEYKSYPHPRSSKVIEALAIYRGAQVGINFAEGYFLLRTKNST